MANELTWHDVLAEEKQHAGGKKLPEREALEMCWQAIDQGASGVDMGRNIFQSDHPVAMMKAVQAVVHHNETADRAYELYLSEKQ